LLCQASKTLISYGNSEISSKSKRLQRFSEYQKFEDIFHKDPPQQRAPQTISRHDTFERRLEVVAPTVTNALPKRGH
jgi:hypothetical protein